MSRKFLTAVDFSKIPTIGLVAENAASPPAAPVAGQFYFDTTGGDTTLYWYDGSGWVAAKGGAGTTLGTSSSVQAIGDTQIPGVSTDASHADHKHGMPAFAAAVADTAYGSAKVDGVAVTVPHSDHTHGNPTHLTADHSAVVLSGLAAPTASLNLNSQKIISLATPTAGSDATTKDYVDNLVAGLSWKGSVRVASTAQRALTGLTAMDGVTPIANDRVLLKNQTAPAENGIWLAQSGAWTRALDADTAIELEGATVFVEEGTAGADTAWTMTTNAPITVGTTGLTWVQFGAGTTITAGAGLTGTTTFDVVAGDATIVVAADAITRAALTGDVTTVVNAATIPNDTVTNAKAANMNAHTFKGNNTGATADPIDLSIAQMQAELGVVVGALSTFALDCAAATSTTVTHNFNTRDVEVQVYRTTTPWDTVECDVERTSVNVVTVTFAVAPTAAQYRIVVQGLDT